MEKILQEIIEETVPRFKKEILSCLEAFNDHYFDWRSKSGFPFLNLTSCEYYLQKSFEKTTEHYVRYFLIRDVLIRLMVAKGHDFYPCEFDHGINYREIKNNRECEHELGFEFMEEKENRKIGYRYTFLPTGKKLVDHLFTIIQEACISEIVIIDWSLSDKPARPAYPLNPRFDGITIRYVTVYDFFRENIDEQSYETFISFLKTTVQELQEYLGVVSIPRLTPPLLFSFRFEVEQELTRYLSSLEAGRNTWNNTSDSEKHVYAYQIINESTKNDVHYANLEHRSLALIYNTRAMREYKQKKYYRALIGRNEFARCLITSEYLYRNYGKSDQFDFTSIVSGYIKSVEQLMYTIVLFSLDKVRSNGRYFQIAPKIGDKSNTLDFTSDNLENGRVDTSLGALCHFFRMNKEALVIGGTYKETMINCLFCYADECRNDNFHKHNINDWDRVEAIRNNTFFLYTLLLGNCKLGESDPETISKLGIAIDDKLSRIYYQLTTHDTLDYYMEMQGQDTLEICRPREEEYPSFDEYGILKNDTLTLEVEHFCGVQEGKPDTIVISNDNLPQRIWYPDDDDCSIEYDLDFQ